jgi:cell filamentation protein
MNDPYLYPDCPVLKNKLGIRDENKLSIVEVEISCNAIRELDNSPIHGDYDFKHFCKFNGHIFGDVYEWAGQPRTIPMEKREPKLAGMSVEYSQPGKIEEDVSAVLDNVRAVQWSCLLLDEQAKNLSDSMTMLWKAHAFREGNTRTVVTFMCHFAESNGINIDRTLFENSAEYMRNALVMASAFYEDGTDFRNTTYLFNIVKDSLERGRQKAVKKH